MNARFPDWRERLAAFIAERRQTPLVWGRSDCCLTVADAVRAMTGVDFAWHLRGYSSRAGAVLALRREGFASVAEYLDAIFPRIPHARAGDVVLVAPTRIGPIALADGRGGVWGQDENGIIRAPMPAATLIWSV